MSSSSRESQEEPGPGQPITMHAIAFGNAVVYQAGQNIYITTGVTPPLLSGPADGSECPYPGLQAFGPPEAQWFFGRGKLTNDLLTLATTRYAAGRLAFVVAASGAGKSSLLKAGLLPAIAGRRLPASGSDQWPQLVLTPTADPLRAVAEGIDLLARTSEEPQQVPVGEADEEQPTVRALVTRLEHALRTRAEAAAAQNPGSPVRSGPLGAVVIVDQFEELFTQCTSQTRQRAFVEWLRLVAAGTASCKALVVCGLRTAYYARCAGFPDLVEALQAAQLIVNSMSTEELTEAIRGPAEAVRLKVEPELVAELLLDLGRTLARPEGEARIVPSDAGPVWADLGSEIPEDAGRLPLLAHALQVTWQTRSAGTLTRAAYQEAGGIAGAIKKTADEAYGPLEPDARAQARRVFLGLVKIGLADVSRQPISRADLARLGPAAQQVVTAYVNCRLLTETADAYQITHEALLYAWPRLRRWIELDRAGNLVRQDLEESAGRWERDRKDPNLLHRGTRLASAQEWDSDPSNAALLTELARDFLRISVSAAQRARRVRRTAVIVLTALAVVASATAAYALQERSIEMTQREAAISQARLAQSEAFATASTNVLATNGPLAMLLSLQGYRRDHTLQAGNALIQAAQQPLRMVLNAGFEVNAVAFLPGSRTLAVADEGKRIELWNPLTGQRTGTLDEGSPVDDLAVSSDGKWLAAADESGHVGLWNLAARTRIGSLDEHSDVETLAFSPDSTMIAGGDGSGHVGIWDVATRRQLATYTAPNQTTIPQDKAIFDVAFSPHGGLLAAGQLGGRVDLWDVATGKRVATLDDDALIYSITFSPDGSTLAVADNKGYIRLYSSRTHKAGKVLVQGGNGAYGLQFGPDGNTLAIGDTMGRIGLWDVVTGKRMATLAQGKGIADLAFSSDGTTLAAGDYTGHIDVWSVAPSLRTARVARGVPVGGVAFSPDGRYLAASGSFSGSVRVWAVATGRQRLAFNVHTGALGISYSPDGRWLAVGTATGQIDLVKLTATGAVAGTSTLKQGNEAFSLAFSPDSRMLATGDHFGGIDLWNMASGALIRTLHARKQVDSLAFSPDGTLIASGDESEYLRIWNVSTGAKVAAIKQGGVIDGVAFSPDGKLLAVGNASGYVGIWKVATRTRIALLSEGAAVNGISFTPNGSTLAVADATGHVKLWNLRTRQAFADLPIAGPGSSVYTLKFSPTGQVLAVGDGSGNVDLLRLDLSHLTQGYFTRAICGRVRSNMTKAQWALYAPGQRYSRTCPGYR